METVVVVRMLLRCRLFIDSRNDKGVLQTRLTLLNKRNACDEVIHSTIREANMKYKHSRKSESIDLIFVATIQMIAKALALRFPFRRKK